MGNLWIGLLIAGIIIVCILLLWASRSGMLHAMGNLPFISPRITEGVYEPLVMLEGMGHKCLNEIEKRAIELIFDIDKNLPAKLYGDGERIGQVIMSLLENAVQYVEEGYVRLLIKIYPVVENEMIEMHVSVKDTGVGIRKEELGRLFSFKRKPREKGIRTEPGSSLYISQRLIRKMGGEIRVKSEEGKGSELWFSVRQKVTDPAPAAVINLPESGRKPRVSAKFSNPYREEALMSLLNMYKISFIPYDILQDVGITVDYLFTDHGAFYEAEQEMDELVRHKEDICVLENPLRDHRKLEGVTILYRPLFSLNFCRFLSQE